MITWTPSAREEVEQCVAAARPRLVAAGADVDEVLADLERHVEEELAAEKISVATRENVRRILSRMGPMEVGMGVEKSVGTGQPTRWLSIERLRIVFMRPGPTVLLLLCVTPLIGFFWLMLYVYVASRQVGHWPFYGQPDPTSIGPWLAGYAFMGVLEFLIAATVAGFPALLWMSARRTLNASASERSKQWIFSIALVGVFVVGTVLFANELYELRAWLLD